MSKVDEIKQQIRVYDERIRELKTELQAAVEEELEQKHGIKKGSRVYWRGGKRIKGKYTRTVCSGLVQSIEPALGSADAKPWLTVHQDKDDGTPGKRLRNLLTDWHASPEDLEAS